MRACAPSPGCLSGGPARAAGRAHGPDAFVDQGLDGGESDAPAGPGDDGCLGGEVEVHDTPITERRRMVAVGRLSRAGRVLVGGGHGAPVSWPGARCAGHSQASMGCQVAWVFSMWRGPKGMSARWMPQTVVWGWASEAERWGRRVVGGCGGEWKKCCRGELGE